MKKLPLLLAATALAVSAQPAPAFDFFGKRRTETQDGGKANPFYWSDMVAPINDGIKNLTITFNTAGQDKKVPASVAKALEAVVTAWQRTTLPADPPTANMTNSIPADASKIKAKASGKEFDTQSILLHELGHALGLDHPNIGGRNPALAGYANSDDYTGNGTPRKFVGEPGPDGIPGTRDDVRGGNRTLFLSDADNNPFNKPPDKIDSTTFKLDRADAMYPNISTQTVAQAPMAATGFTPVSNLTSVMTAYSTAGKTVRSITWDDWAGLRYLEAGKDQLAGTNDDYTFNLIFNANGINAPDNLIPPGTNILISMNPALPEDHLGHSIPKRFGQNGIVSGVIELILEPDTEEILGMAVLWLDGPEESLGTSIVFVDLFLPTEVPEPGTLALLVAAPLLLLRRRRSLCMLQHGS